MLKNGIEQAFSYSKWAINFLMQSSQATSYFIQNLQDLDLIYMDNINNNDSEEVEMANTSANLISDVLINQHNGTLNILDISWTNDNTSKKLDHCLS